MIKGILYLNKVRKFKDSFFSKSLPKEIGTKRNKSGIPVVVLDLKTKQSYVYVSIAEAARSFNTHPKTIWRIIYNNKLYLNRYQIIEQNNKLEVQYFMFKFYKLISEYLYYILNVLKNNKVSICRILLFIILVIVLCIFMYNILILCRDIYDQYVFSVRENKVNYIKCVLEHKSSLNQVLSNTKITYNRARFIDIKEWRYDYNFKGKWTDFNNTNSELGIYKSIMNEINLDFNAKGTGTFSGINSSYSSPIIERININNIFSNAISSTNTHNSIPNSLGIHGIDYSSNRNSVIVDNVLMNTKVRTTELLNYNSNILYCLINGLSPSIY